MEYVFNCILYADIYYSSNYYVNVLCESSLILYPTFLMASYCFKISNYIHKYNTLCSNYSLFNKYIKLQKRYRISNYLRYSL